MSEFKVEVSKVFNVQKHPNADTLSIAEVNGYPVIFRNGDFSEGDLAVHVPIDSVVPDTAEWSFLGGHRRIKAKRLRGVFSMGLLSKAIPEWSLGQNVQADLGIEKYEPPANAVFGTENESPPEFLHIYTDIEGLRRWPDILVPGEEVILTEKIHGANSRFLFQEDRLWVGSHNCVKKPDENNTLWKVAKSLSLEEKLRAVTGITIYGEVFGSVQDLKYGSPTSVRLNLFDAKDTRTQKYLDYDDFLALARQLDLPTVPELYRGPWAPELVGMAEGLSTVPMAAHIREGFVVKPVKERWDMLLGRVVLKMVGEGYLLRKGA